MSALLDPQGFRGDCLLEVPSYFVTANHADKVFATSLGRSVIISGIATGLSSPSLLVPIWTAEENRKTLAQDLIESEEVERAAKVRGISLLLDLSIAG